MTRRLLVTLACAALVSSPVQAQPTETPVVLALGARAPMANAKMLGVDGREVTLAGLKGERGTLVIFTCNSCPWVKAWEKRIVTLGNQYARRGIGVIAINSNDPGRNAEDDYEAMQRRARERGMRFPYVVDATSDVARAFGATRTPEVFLFNASGALVYHGAIDDNAKEPAKVSANYLRDALQAQVDKQAIPVAETKALGCSIKFRAKT